jgi:hypothetical protein
MTLSVLQVCISGGLPEVAMRILTNGKPTTVDIRVSPVP